MRDHPDALEADLQRYYRVDLADLWRGGLTLRRLSSLTAHLPPGSAVWCIQNDIDLGWSNTDLLLADVFHATTGKPHPARPEPGVRSRKARAAKLTEKLLEQRERQKLAE